jgi:PAN domain
MRMSAHCHGALGGLQIALAMGMQIGSFARMDLGATMRNVFYIGAVLVLLAGSATAQNKVGGAGASATQPNTTKPDTTTLATGADSMIDSPGFDVFGNDLPAIRDVELEQCRAFCVETSVCVAMTYRQDLRRCYPKSSASLLVRNTKSDAAIKSAIQANLKISAFELFPQSDVQGLDYANSKTADAQSCLALCEADKNCNAFAYATTNKTCYLKATVGAVIDAPAVVSGKRN